MATDGAVTQKPLASHRLQAQREEGQAHPRVPPLLQLPEPRQREPLEPWQRAGLPEATEASLLQCEESDFAGRELGTDPWSLTSTYMCSPRGLPGPGGLSRPGGCSGVSAGLSCPQPPSFRSPERAEAGRPAASRSGREVTCEE